MGVISINFAGPVVEQEWVTGQTIIDDGYYNGFPMIADAEGLTTYGIYKKSTSHASGGPLMLIKTTDGGNTWTENAIQVDDVEIASTNHSFQRLSTGRMLISYRVSGVMYFAYNDNNDHNFTSSATVVSPTTDNIVAQSPIKMYEMPSGNILFAYYQVGSNGNPATQELMRSTDEGETFTAYSQIHSGNSSVSNETVGSWRGNEVAIAITHNTGADATCKMIAIVRTEIPNDGGTYPMVFKSEDGGANWSKNLSTSSGSITNDLGTTLSGSTFSKHLLYSFLHSNSPVDIRLFEGLIYVIIGERNTTYGPALKVITATPDDAFDNSIGNWTNPRLIKMFTVGGATYDHGYPVFFTANGELYTAHYDMSTQSPNGLSAKRVISEIVKVSE